jgi:hypothetical protein
LRESGVEFRPRVSKPEKSGAGVKKRSEGGELNLQSIAYPVGILILSMAPNYFQIHGRAGQKSIAFFMTSAKAQLQRGRLVFSLES